MDEDEIQDDPALSSDSTPEIETEENPNPSSDTIPGEWQGEGDSAVYMADDGRRFNSEGELIEDEPEPVSTEPEKPEKRQIAVPKGMEDDERAQLKAAFESLDGEQMLSAVERMADRIASRKVELLTTSQALTSPFLAQNPDLAEYAPLAQQHLRAYVEANPEAVNDPAAQSIAFLNAAIERGYQNGDVDGEVAKYLQAAGKAPKTSKPPTIPPAQRMTRPSAGGPVTIPKRESVVERMVKDRGKGYSDSAKKAYADILSGKDVR